MSKCPECQREFGNPGALAAHVKLKHTVKPSTPKVDVGKLQSTIRRLLHENDVLVKKVWKLEEQLYIEKMGHPLLFQQGKYCQHCGELMSDHRTKPGVFGQIALCPKDFK